MADQVPNPTTLLVRPGRGRPRRRSNRLIPILYDDLAPYREGRAQRPAAGDTLQARALVRPAYRRLIEDAGDFPSAERLSPGALAIDQPVPAVRRGREIISMTTRMSAVIMCVAIALGGSRLDAATVSIDCDAGASVSQAIGALRPGDTLVVSGTCKESVFIPADAVGITLTGQGRATIQHPGGATVGPAAHGIYVRGRVITITGFTVRGGSDGIHLSGPAHAVIDGNVVSNNTGRGIHLDKGSVAQIAGNTIRDNGAEGINVTEQSYARIGFLIPPDERPRANTVRDNRGDAIRVDRGSHAWIVGNAILRNAGSGLVVDRSSQADVIGNAITGNAGDGIAVTHNSGVNFVSEGTTRRETGNQTDRADKNGGAGVRCSIGGYVAGPIGTLMGTRGARAIDRSCADRTVDR